MYKDGRMLHVCYHVINLIFLNEGKLTLLAT